MEIYRTFTRALRHAEKLRKSGLRIVIVPMSTFEFRLEQV
jgi:hypothetical protein